MVDNGHHQNYHTSEKIRDKSHDKMRNDAKDIVSPYHVISDNIRREYKSEKIRHHESSDKRTVEEKRLLRKIRDNSGGGNDNKKRKSRSLPRPPPDQELQN